MKTVKVLLKRFAELATEFARRLSKDKFVPTEGAILCILLLLCISYLIIISVASHFLNLTIAREVINALSSVISSGNYDVEASSEIVAFRINDIRNAYVVMIAITCIAVTAIFGYIASKLVLSPTRNALALQKIFIGHVAHELRTPLSIVTANHEIALQEDKLGQNAKELVLGNLEELTRMKDIISNLLNLNSLTNTEAISFEVVNFSDAFVNSTHGLFLESTNKQILITTNLEPDVYLLANKSSLVKIITTLFRSAINYTPPKGTIHIDIYNVSSETVRLCLKDSGTHVKQYRIRKFFNPLYKNLSKDHESKHFNSLSMSMINKLIIDHHGSITVQTHQSSGTSIVVDFPRYVK